MAHIQPTPEFSIPLSSLDGTVLDLSHIPPQVFRFISISSFLAGTLTIVSTSTPHTHAYAALSYPWFDLQLTPSTSLSNSLGNFLVHGAEVGGIASLDVLRTACLAISHLDAGTDLLWLDRVCIKQTDKSDKIFQIHHMYDIYAQCSLCVVLPGGIQRVARADEGTNWLKRAWTLQEALVPRRVEVVFDWNSGGEIATSLFPIPPIRVPGDARASHMNLNGCLQACMNGCGIKYRLVDPDPEVEKLYNLSGEERKGEEFISEKFALFENTEASTLQRIIGEGDQELKQGGMWKGMWMRTSSRPIDMVFSIMGMFGVTLDPSQYKAHERERATLELAKQVLNNGGKASWLGMALNIAPSPRISTLPDFPETKESGGAFLMNSAGVMTAVTDIIDPSWFLRESPEGYIDDDGFLVIERETCGIRKLAEGEDVDADADKVAKSGDRQNWILVPAQGCEGQYLAVWVGKLYWSVSGQMPLCMRPDPCVLMVVRKPSGGGDSDEKTVFNVRTYLTCPQDWIDGWEKEHIVVGGPRAA